MNLIQLVRRNAIITMFLVVLIGSVSHFFIFRYFIHYSTDQVLTEYKQRIISYIALHDTIPLSNDLILQPARIEIQPITDITQYPSEIHKDTLLYSEVTGSFTPYRQLYFPVNYRNKSFLININQPTMESNDLLYAVVASLLILFTLSLLFVYATSYSLKNSVWRPLNKNLKKLRAYGLRANSVLQLEKSDIQEFDELNEVIMKMVDKINEDYENSRMFSENASHEMQTPLSIIRSKIDLLLQENVPEDERISNLVAMSRATTRLSRLNRSLLLLTKINNDHFQDKKQINISSIIENYLFDLSELIESKKIILTSNIQPYTLNISTILAEVLVSNILSNAIKHNIENGKIDISLKSGLLTIENNCKLPDNTDNLFNRHNRPQSRSNAKNSTGLGMSIIKSICDKNEFKVKYVFKEGNVFCFELDFN